MLDKFRERDAGEAWEKRDVLPAFKNSPNILISASDCKSELKIFIVDNVTVTYKFTREIPGNLPALPDTFPAEHKHLIRNRENIFEK